MDWQGVAGKRVIVTGATRGIGLAASKELARRGAKLTITARSPARAEAAKSAIGADVDVLFAHLESQASVRTLARSVLDAYDRVHVLVNNAGAVNRRRQVTEDGIELTWAANHLAPFLLTNLLLDRLRASAPARVITTSSDAHRGARIPFDDLAGERGYGPFGLTRYGQTKLANILFTRELARRLAGTGVEAFCFHPGFVASGFNRNNGALLAFGMALTRPFVRSAEKGAETLVWLADSSEPAGHSGEYFQDRRVVAPARVGRDDEVAERLWSISADQTHDG